LYEYIIADDNKQKNKPSKKGNAKGGVNNNANNVNNVNNANNIPTNTTKKKNANSTQIYNTPTLTSNEIDKEIEEFRNKIKNESVHANDIRKVRPKISVEWIQYITKI
jgi:hypothetical protein